VKGFRDTTKMMHGHNFARGGHSIQPQFGNSPIQSHLPHASPAPGRGAGPGVIGGLTDHGNPNDGKQAGHAAVHREVPSNETEAEHGGKGPLMPGYAKGGKHFHVHKHYHTGGKVTTKSRTYSKAERAAEMQSEKRFTAHRSAGGFGKGTTGGTRPKIAKGGGIHIKPSNRGKFTKKMTGSKSGKLTDSDVDRGLSSSSPATRKQANFARMARRGFKPLKKAEGGRCTRPKYAEGGSAILGDTWVDHPPPARKPKGAGGALYARGGHSKEMNEHLNAAAPRGHKGLGAMIRRGG